MATILEESLSERLAGLTEMFPESVRVAVSEITCKTKSLCKNVYNISRQVVWIGVSSSLILFAPVMFEVERYNVEEMVKQDRNRLVLGPGSAMSGPAGHPGLSR
ncbi:Mitochondrial import receptor subunit TOM22-like protein [Armadillidium nasatum]|uniref:Mitochondrial import receptor subunit TOM22 homolog n=1 Tax=Armadillidium nasatum TaxID=96803 RepID=A0A5N5SLK7_9CRUS|nr:Mitochondrial import receptor subunit TOM22-like protein [Armadillidium nasatum]